LAGNAPALALFPKPPDSVDLRMAETRKLAAILAADVVGYSKLAGADEERTLARLRALRSDLIDPTIAPDSAQGRLRDQGVPARLIVALRDD